MTTMIPDDYYDEMYSRPHPAILLTVDEALSTAEGLAVSRAIRELLMKTSDRDDMLPVWVRFVAFDATEVHFLQPYFCPSDKLFLAKLVIEIDAVRKHTSVSSFDFSARQYPKRTHRATPVSPRLKREGHSDGTPYLNINRLPLSLRFFQCPAAHSEAKELGTIYSRWPFVGFSNGDLLGYAERLAAEFEQRYPYLAEADRAICGRLTKVIEELGKHPHQPAFELRQFWTAVKKGDVSGWSGLADNLLEQVVSGQVDRFRWHEEVLETPVETHLYRDPKVEGRRPIRSKPIPIHCPPSVPSEIWDLVPTDRQREAAEYGARSLRRGVHPEVAIADFVAELAIAQN